ncbi:uncharacterized protein LOC125827346 [Solanum verrucosum]|uniref:uncharacterized protein LOC125827346 n=1 Tax=Solanum verrucosum TaxID=315347 RepID=UPI0020D067E6|nr:uncharacterized protein LOC125827346 [Solanum verrucosum]
MIEKAIFWNIRSVKSQKAFERLRDLNRKHKCNFIALMKPFQGPQELEQYKKKLGMENLYCKCASKIWVFWEDDWKGEVFRESGQHLTVKISKSNVEILNTVVYAICDALQRLELLEELEQFAEDNTLPWLVGGDFNVILNEEEKQGGLEFTQFEAMDFSQCIKNCALIELKYSRSKFT